jgi:hypothetical protein
MRSAWLVAICAGAYCGAVACASPPSRGLAPTSPPFAPFVPTAADDPASDRGDYPCEGFPCPASARCVVWSSGPRCIAHAEDAVPFWPDDPCDTATCPPGKHCSLAGAGFECIPTPSCRTVTTGASPECPWGQWCTPARASDRDRNGTAARPFCAFEPPPARDRRGPVFMAPSGCERYLATATVCLPQDLRHLLYETLEARLTHRLRELQDGAARDRLEDQCDRGASLSSTWCEAPDVSATSQTPPLPE